MTSLRIWGSRSPSASSVPNSFLVRRFVRAVPRILALVSLAAVLVTEPGCKQEQSAPLPEKPLVLDPVPVPADLIADVYIPNPDTAWGKARLAISGPAMFLPASTGSLAATLFGLPITVGSEIDGNVPVVGAILEGKDGGRTRVAMALHLRAADKFIHLLIQGENAKRVKRVDEKTQITLLELENGLVGSATIGVLGNYLVAAPTKEELLEVAPYVVRNLTTAKMPANDITIDMPRAALEGPVAKMIRTRWEGIKPRPRADSSTVTTLPSPLQTLVDGLLGVVGELDRGKAMIDFDQQVAHVRFSGTPKTPLPAGSHIASMTVGDPKKLLDLPGTTDVALFVHDTSDVRVNDAKGYATALINAIGKDVTDEDKAAIEKALEGLAKSRGDTFTAGLSLLPTGPGVFVRAAMSNRDELTKSITDLTRLPERKSVASWLGELGLKMKAGTTVIEGLPGDLNRIRLERVEPKVSTDKPGAKPGAKSPEPTKKDEKKDDKGDKTRGAAGVPSTIDILYVFGTENVVLGAGYEAHEALKLILEASAKDNLGTRTDVATALSSLGDKATFVAVADLLRLFARQSGGVAPSAGAPLVFGLGKGGTGFGADEPWMRLDVPNVVLQEIVKRRGAF